MNGPRIVKDSYVVLDYALYDADGDLVEATDDDGGVPIGFVHGYGIMLAALEHALVGMAAGETREVELSSDEAYGPWNADGEMWVERGEFGPDIAVDDELGAIDEQGEETTLRVVEVRDDGVLVDSNHPLAGESLRFDVIVRTVRPATAKEIAEVRAVAPKPSLRILDDAAGPPPAPRHSETAPSTHATQEKVGNAPPTKPKRPPMRDPLSEDDQ